MKIVQHLHFAGHDENCYWDLYTIDDPSLWVRVQEKISKYLLGPLGYHKWCMVRVTHQYGVTIHSINTTHGVLHSMPERYAGDAIEQLIKQYDR